MSHVIFHQLFEKETSTYTYLLADPDSMEAIIIDPVHDTVERDFLLISELGFKLKYIFDTHVHADHITGSGELKKKTHALIGLSESYPTTCPDIALKDGQELTFGSKKIQVLSTPGHTNGCLSFLIEDMIFTGDALLVRGCGRTDFQDGSSEKLFHSVREKIFSLPDSTLVYPAHDYKGFLRTDIGTEKRLNPRLKLGIDLNMFVKIMSELKLDQPKRINEAVPANLQCGINPQNA